MGNTNCPLRQEPYECDKKDCAWWGDGECCIQTAAHALYYIGLCLSTIANNEKR